MEDLAYSLSCMQPFSKTEPGRLVGDHYEIPIEPGASLGHGAPNILLHCAQNAGSVDADAIIAGVGEAIGSTVEVIVSTPIKTRGFEVRCRRPPRGRGCEESMSHLPAEMNRIARFFDGEYADYAEDGPVLNMLALRAQGPLLELGCGTGRALLPLAEAGFEIDGIDSSPAMLKLASARVEASGLSGRVQLIEGDFTQPLPASRYRFVFALMNTFLHLRNQEQQLAALRAWHRALAPAGLLLIEVFSPDVAELAALDGRLEWDRTWTDPATGRRVVKLLARTVEPADQVMHVSHIYEETDDDDIVRRSIASFELRYLWRFEAELLLEKAGFAVEALYGDWDMSNYDSASARMIFVSQKRQSR